MRNIQFAVLLILSIIVSLFMVKEILLSRAIIYKQHELVDFHKTAETDQAYESGWKELALKIYKASLHDPSMVDLLKSEQISIHEGLPPGSTAAPAAPTTSPATIPSTSSKPTQAAPTVAPH